MIPSVNHPINCGSPSATFVRQHSKKSLANRSFILQASEIRRVTESATTSTITSGAKIFTRKTSAGYVTDFFVYANRLFDGYFQPISIVSTNTNILSNINTNGISTYQGAGECIFIGESVDGEVSLLKVTSNNNQGVTVDIFQSWVNGSLASHSISQITSLTANKNSLNVFNNGTFIRNPLCWANGIDLSCASPWNSTAGSLRAGTLISSRHVLFCKHSSFYPNIGASIRFVSADNVVISRTLTAINLIQNADIAIGILDSDVPNEISFAKILPPNYASYIPGLNSVSTVPVMTLNQTDRASIAALRGLNSYFENAYPSDYENYAGTIISGDSGNPTFLIVNGEPILLGVFTYGGYGGGSHVAYHTVAINNAMTALGGDGYQLTHADLSSFNSY